MTGPIPCTNGNDFGLLAKQAAFDLTFGKDVTLQTHGLDKYGRTLADVLLSDGTNVNYTYTLVKDGWCWWYRKYAPGDTILKGFEKEAQDDKRGLWADPSPIPSWVYRKARRVRSLDLSDFVPLDAETEAATTTRGPPLLGAVEPDSPTSTSPYPIIGNRRSNIYHRPDRPNYSQVAPHNRVAFNGAAEAEAAGDVQPR